VTSLNHRLAFRNADGKIRVVIANRDPGVANWLDTEGRSSVVGTIRWWRVKDSPHLHNQVVVLDELRAILPSDTPVVSASERREELRRRAAHVAWRYHT
jgi:hypothetical protein